MIFDEKSRQAGRLLLVLDALLAALVFLTTYWVRELIFLSNPSDYYAHLALFPLILVIQTLLLFRFGAYRGLRISSIVGYAWMVSRALAFSFLIFLTILFLLKATYVSRSFLLMYGVADLVALVAVRAGLVWWYFHRSVERNENFLKVLIVGTGQRAKHLSRTLREHSEWGIDVIGYLDLSPPQPGATVLGSPVLGTVDQIGSLLKQHVIDEVIVAIPRTMIKDVQYIADACEEEGVKLRLMADVFDLQVSRLRLADLGGIPLLTFEPVAQDEKMLIVKRVMDLVVTLAFMPLVLLLMGLVAVAIKLDSPGPVLFVQERVGLRKRPFRMYKFRSMRQDAEQKLKEIEHLNEAEGPIFKIANDPRITRVGKFIRRTSLDELPQLFNVIRGHMSLVGPRPMSVRDVDLFDKGVQRKRFSVRPGLTCLWQVSGRSSLPFTKWLELDLEYIDNWTLGLDFKILLKTIPTVLKGSGAV
jgi:exopolysaccharide biosynthesis polyprenyl glycosylphosphotransferase